MMDGSELPIQNFSDNLVAQSDDTKYSSNDSDFSRHDVISSERPCHDIEQVDKSESNFAETPVESEHFESSLDDDDSPHQIDASQSASACDQSSESSSVNSASIDFSCCLKDYGLMSSLMNLLPAKAQKGIRSFPVKINCLDASETNVIVGCNIDSLFLYDKHHKNIRKLRCDSSHLENITAVALISSVELMAAAGSSSGAIIVFRIPVHPSNQGVTSVMEKYNVQKLHKHQITCLKWSQNAMKLYCGDSSGLVTCTNILYDNHGSSAEEVLREDSSIIQLDYYQQMLLVSTANRAFVCYAAENKRIMQVGAKSRKCPGNFGALFYPSDIPPQRKNENIIFTSRPGLRIWKANATGVVSETLLFKDALVKDMATAKLLGDVDSTLNSIQPDQQFGPILLFEKKYLVTFTKNYIFIINPRSSEILASFQSASAIISVSVMDDEILVLQQSCSIIRIACKPEELQNSNVKFEPNPNLKPIQSGLKDLSSRLQEMKSQSNILSDIKSSISKGEKQLKNFKLPDISKVTALDSSNLSKGRQILQDYSMATLLQNPERSNSAKTRSSPSAPSDKATQNVESQEDNSVDSENLDEKLKISESLEDISVSSLPSTLESREKSTDFENSTAIKVESKNERFKLEPDIDFGEIVYKPKKKKGKRKNKTSYGQTMYLEAENDSSGTDISRNVSASELQALVTCRSEKETIPKLTSVDPVIVATDPRYLEAEDFVKSSEESNDNAVHESLVESKLSKLETSDEKLVDDGKSQHPSQKERDEFLSQILTLDMDKYNDHEKETESSHGIAVSPTPTDTSKEEADDFSSRLDETKCDFSDLREIYKASTSQTDSIEDCDSVDAPQIRPENVQILPEIASKQTKIAKSPESIATKSFGTGFGSSESESINSIDVKKTQDINEKSRSENIMENSPLPKFFLPERQASEFDELDDMMPRLDIESKYCDNWMLHEGPGLLVSLCITKYYIVCVDNYDNVYYSNLSQPGLTWDHLDYHAHHVSVSESGNLVWRIYNGNVYAAKLGSCNPYKPVVSSWIELMRNVSWVSLDETCAWLKKASGSVYLIRNINTLSPVTELVHSDTESFKVKQIACQNDVVWVLTNNHKIYYRNGISPRNRQGREWKIIKSSLLLQFISISLCPNKTGWAIDKNGSIWFRNGVAPELPAGIGDDWWEVNISGYIHRDSTTFDVFKSAMSQMYPERLITAFHPHSVNISLTTGQNGVWFCTKDTKELWGNNSYIVGHRLEICNLRSSISGTLTWNDVQVESVEDNEGLIWFLKNPNELLYLNTNSKKLQQIPSIRSTSPIFCVASSAKALWVLTKSGEIYIRPVLQQSHSIGNSWQSLPLNQISDLHIVHISCSSNVVWACDKLGNVYLRIGPLYLQMGTLPPAWIPIDGYSVATKSIIPTQFKAIQAKPEPVRFCKVHVGPNTSMVWAIDTKMNIYVREGLTEDFDVGTSWLYVSGIQAEKLTISNYAVWALTSGGSIYRRFGISQSNCMGDYWKKMPGCLQHISVTADDELWGLTNDGVAVQHFAFQLQFEGRKRVDSMENREYKTGTSIDDNDWEVV